MSKLTVEQFNTIIEEELPWASDSGIKLEDIGPGTATMRLPYDHRSTRPGGTISGPHMMMLADACMYAVVLSKVGKVKLAVTTNFNVNFLRKPSESDLIAEGSAIKIGKRLAIMEVSVFAEGNAEKGEENQLVAHATGTYSIPPNE